MKIQSLMARNFKNYELKKFEPQKTTVAVVGKNGMGKTTLTQAIRYALTGDLPENPVRKGADELEVSVLLDDGTDFERMKSNTKPSKVKLNGKTVTAKALAAHLEVLSGVSLEGMKLSSSGELIENLKPEEFASFIMQYIPEALDFDMIKTYMGTVPTSYYDTLEKYFPKTGTFGYSVVKEKYKAMYEQRKVTKALLTQKEARVNGFTGEKPEYTMAEVDKKMEFIIQQEGKHDGLKKANEIYKRAVEGQKKQDELIKDYEDKLKALGEVKKPDPNILTNIEKRKKELNNSIVQLSSTIVVFRNNIKSFEDTIKNLNSPYCPLSEGLICKTDKTAKKEEFKEQIEANKVSIVTIEKEIAEKRSELEKLAESEKEYRAKLDLYNKKIHLIQAHEAAMKARPVLPAKPEPVDEEVDYSFEKKELNALKAKLIQYEQQLKDIDQAKLLREEYEILDALIKLFAPKGAVMQHITEYYFGMFEEVCNERAKTLRPGFSVKFVPDDGIRILVETKAGRGYIPFENCSSGEKAYVVFLLMDLISGVLTEAKIMILDDLDKLDKEAFDCLIGCIMNKDVQDAYDHIIICAVDHTDTIDTLSKYPEIELMKI